MRLLVDSCCSHRLAERLKDAGHEVVYVGDWQRDPGDLAILRRAIAETRVLITLDKGFSALAFEQRMRHAGIILLRNVNPLEYYALIERAIEAYGADLETGAMVVIGLSGMRRRRSPFDKDA